ncbi:MAG: hypothetical protein COA33_013335 [Fluviicola sp.]|nr:hypothetical protein [Fluviicola sp.]
MKTTFTLAILFLSLSAFSQNINDNKVTFQYTQLPLLKVDKQFQTYEMRVEHAYLESNKDSTSLFEARKAAAKQNYEVAYARYKQKRDALLTNHYNNMALWEKNNNAGKVDAAGNPIPRPVQPAIPAPPSYLDVQQPRLSSPLAESNVSSKISIDGFSQGLGGSILTVSIQAIRNIKITYKKQGSGASTKYKYQCEYELPILVKFETPTEGVVLQEVILQEKQYYKMTDRKSHYEHLAYMQQNELTFYNNLEVYARNNAMKKANDYLNNQLGYISKTRRTEIYSVKKFKSYDYSDVTNAYTATVSALQLVGKDLNHASAKSKMENALAQWNEILIEKNNYDKKARINDKISAVIWCNVAEIQFWLNLFDESQGTVNLAENSGVMKAKNHAKSERNFYTTQKARWDVHF